MTVTIDGTNGINDTVLGSSTPAAANVTTLGASGEVTATGFTGTLDGILGSGSAAAATTTTLASTTITASGIIKTDDTTAATSTTDGSLQTDGGLSVAADAVIGDDLFMLSDAAVLTFGADKDVTLTHVADTGILLNSTMAIQFNDASQYINAPSNAILDINATDEIELNATLIDINGNVDISGTALITGVATHGDDVVSDTDSTDDLGTTGVRWANLFVDAITATDQITATGFTGTLDGILGSGTPAAATVTTIDASGVATATTFEPDGDTAAGDNAAIGYTAAEGLILTGQGSTSDITFKNDADAIVMSIPTGTTNVGIGTTAPATKLDVVTAGDNTITSRSTGGAGLFHATGVANAYTGFFINSVSTNLWSIQTRADTNLHLYRASGSGNVIVDSGKVGIGTAAPATELHVVGDVTVAGGITGLTSINSGQIGGRRNIVYNGEMKVAQRSASETGLGAAVGYFTLDRWKTDINGTAGRFTMAQVADGPPGFANSLKISTTTADTSIAAGEYFLIRQLFEGQDLQQLKKGTASAEQVTVSFWVKGNAAAVYVCEFEDTTGRLIQQSFAVTTSWNRIELTFVGDTSDPLDDDNASRLILNFWLHAGSTFGGGTFTSNTWADTVQANRAAVDDFTSIFDATSRTLFVTGVQMEIGATATEFEHRTFGDELALCQRYYQQQFTFNGYASNTTAIQASAPCIISMRATPTLSAGGVLTVTDGVANYAQSSLSITGVTGTPNGISFNAPNFSSLTQFRPCMSNGTASSVGSLAYSAEL